MCLQKGRAVKRDVAFPLGSEHRGQAAGGFGSEEIFVRRGSLGQPQQRRVNGGLLGAQAGQQIQPHAVAEECPLPVGKIPPHGQPARAGIGHGFGAAQGQQRAHQGDVFIPGRENPPRLPPATPPMTRWKPC